MINSTPRILHFKMTNTEIKMIYISEGKAMPDQQVQDIFNLYDPNNKCITISCGVFKNSRFPKPADSGTSAPFLLQKLTMSSYIIKG